MKADGFTLVELIVVLSISTIILSLCFRLYQSQCMVLKSMDERIESNANLRIAMDFLCDRVKESKTFEPGNERIIVDEGSIYLEDNILRFVSDAQQIAYGIHSFDVILLKDGLYRIRVSSSFNDMELDTYVCNRNISDKQ